jgi:hypothetical protein
MYESIVKNIEGLSSCISVTPAEDVATVAQAILSLTQALSVISALEDR